jgi:hypothetical protein
MDGDENEQQSGDASNDTGGSGETGYSDGGTTDDASSLDRPGDVTSEIREGDEGENKAR